MSKYSTDKSNSDDSSTKSLDEEKDEAFENLDKYFIEYDKNPSDANINHKHYLNDVWNHSNPDSIGDKLDDTDIEIAQQVIQRVLLNGKHNRIDKFVDSFELNEPRMIPYRHDEDTKYQKVVICKIKSDNDFFAIIKIYTKIPLFTLINWKHLNNVLRFKLIVDDGKDYINLIARMGFLQVKISLLNFIVNITKGDTYTSV